jgi:hypothetical protein
VHFCLENHGAPSAPTGKGVGLSKTLVCTSFVFSESTQEGRRMPVYVL